ncbi:MAG: hypothetical protein AAGI34_02705 [Pseudomonadota bacterium]
MRLVAAALALAGAASFAEAVPLTPTVIFADAAGQPGDNFAAAVAIDQGRVLIGAQANSTNAREAGRAFLFAESGALLQTFDAPNPAEEDGFGDAVALSGNRVLIGASGEDVGAPGAGRAYLFDADTGALLQTFANPNPTQDAGFGEAVAIDGTRVTIGAPAAGPVEAGQTFLFDADTGALVQTFDSPNPSAGDEFGDALAIDGTSILIGAAGDDTFGFNAGQAFLFDAGGSLLSSFADPVPVVNDLFGDTVDLDGTLVLVGAPLSDPAGNASGEAFLFDAQTGTLLQSFADPNPGIGDAFGEALALDDGLIAIGASNDNTNGAGAGLVFLFDAQTGALLQILDDPEPGAGDFFGDALDVFGGQVLVGAQLDQAAAGRAFLFEARPIPLPPAFALMLSALGLLAVLRGKA